MSIASFFEDFSDGTSASRGRVKSRSDPIEGYETGYQAGWDDAVKAHKDARTHLNTTLTQNLEQIEFTLVEAQTQLLSTIRPVLQEIANTLLPGLTSEGLRSLVVNEIETLLKTHAAKDVSLIVSEQDEPAIAAFLNTSRTLSEISLVVKDTISEGQAYITCADLQRKVDVGRALAEIQSTLDSFLNQPELEQTYAR